MRDARRETAPQNRVFGFRNQVYLYPNIKYMGLGRPAVRHPWNCPFPPARPPFVVGPKPLPKAPRARAPRARGPAPTPTRTPATAPGPLRAHRAAPRPRARPDGPATPPVKVRHLLPARRQVRYPRVRVGRGGHGAAARRRDRGPRVHGGRG